MRGRHKEGSSHPVWLEPFKDRVSGLDGFRFRVEYRIEFRDDKADSSRRQVLMCATMVRAIVEPALARCDVLRPVAAEQDVNLELEHRLPREGHGVSVTRAFVTVRVDDDTTASAERLARARQNAKADTVELDRLRARMAFLEEEVLRDPASVRLFLLAEGIGQGKAGTSPSVSDIHAAAGEVRQWSRTNRWVDTAKILHEHFDSLPDDSLRALLATLRDSIKDHDNQRLLGRFDDTHGPFDGQEESG